ncbi:MAG: ABC transporter substrate binding protein [Desulfuromonadaceae bacterium]|nr:ABC transporter substrate binding protein [Desulfuromonadaceae bacterium]MDD5107440.1 ABC transporter substrate binding protein [Desulfuromonadaceae bacterium]
MPHILLHTLFFILLAGVPCLAADVLIIADTQLKPVMEVTFGMRKTLRASVSTLSPSEVRGNLTTVVQQEGSRVVIALGREALAEALTLPTSIPVIYDMVVIPPKINRPNTVGFYMATPASKYAELLHKHLPALKRMTVVASRDFLNILTSNTSSMVSSHSVKNLVEFVSTIKQMGNTEAILLLPDSGVMNSTAIEEVFLHSFRQNIPVLGISERHVKEGALLALVVDMVDVGKIIGEYATMALKKGGVGQLSALPPRKFELYLNMDTARKMGIRIPDEVVRMARKSYP